jgi:serine/threonine protein kinase
MSGFQEYGSGSGSGSSAGNHNDSQGSITLPGRITELGGNRLIKRMGAGAMGEVWLAEDLKLGRKVALKLMRREIAEEPEYVARFQREARAVAMLNHPNIVQIYQVGEEHQLLFYTMEFVEGSSLAARISNSGNLSPREAVQILLQAIEALDFACEMGVIHRDIKPENIMISSRGIVKIADFGLAKIMDADSRMTATGAMMGSPSYMSPEQARGESADQRSDIYSLGITFFQMLTGELPHRGSTPFKVMMKHIQEPLPEPPELASLAGGAILDVMRKMTAKEPENRFLDYKQLRAAIDRLPISSIGSGFTPTLANATIGKPVYIPSTTGRPATRTRRFDKKSAVVIAAVIIIGGLAAGYYLFGGEEDLPPVNYQSAMSQASPAPSPPIELSTHEQSVANLPANQQQMTLPPPETPEQTTNPPPEEFAQPPPQQQVASAPQPMGGGAQNNLAPRGMRLKKSELYQRHPVGKIILARFPDYGRAFDDYDFAAMQRDILQLQQAGASSGIAVQTLAQMADATGKLVNLRNEIISRARDRKYSMTRPEYGNLTLVDAHLQSLTFINATGATLSLTWSEIRPHELMSFARQINPSTGEAQMRAIGMLYPAPNGMMQGPNNQGR